MRLLPLLIALTFSVSALATPSTPERPNYSKLKRLSSWEIQQELEVFIGKKDQWRNQSNVLNRVRSYLPFKKNVPTIQEEVTELSYIHARKSPKALQEYILKAMRSPHKEVRSMIATVQGDKRIAYDMFKVDSKPKQHVSMLFFFKNIQYGDTDLESKKFQHFGLAFQYLAYQIEQSYKAARSLNMPLIIEFESSALINESPLTRMFFNLLTNDPSGLTKIQVTPNNGRIVSLYPARAERVVQNLVLFSDQFKKTIRVLQNRYFESPEIKSRLIDLVRTGEGISGLFYIDEKIVEIATTENSTRSANSCSALFSGI